MAREDAELGPDSREPSARNDMWAAIADPFAKSKRGGRASELFSQSKYREVQLSWFEYRKSRGHRGDPRVITEAEQGEAAVAALAPLFAPAADDRAGVSGEAVQVVARSASEDMVETAAVTYDFVAFEEERDRAVQTDAPGGDKAPTTERGGRDLRMATVVGLVLLGVSVAAAIVHPIAFAVLLYAACIVALFEWRAALARHGRKIPMVPIVAATLGMGVATYFAKPEGLVVALLVGCAGVVAWRIGDERLENTMNDSLAGVLTLLWIPFLASFLFLLEVADDGWQRVIVLVLAVVGNDTGALIAGMKLGKHKLLPRVSPAKTWEGAAGGLLLGTAAAAGAAFFLFDGAWYIGAVVGACAAIAAVFGDLAESALKRDVQVKDMSSVLPGHGGVLDRLDSLVFAAPVGYVAFAFFVGTL